MSHLSVLAAALAPGASVACNVEGDGSGYEESIFTVPGGSTGDYSYSSVAAYDSVRDLVAFALGEHTGNTHVYRYPIATNVWARSSDLGIGGLHSYDSNAIVGDYLYTHGAINPPSAGGPARFYKTHLDTGVTTLLAETPFYHVEHSLCYFPDKDELLWSSGGYFGGIAKYNGLHGGPDTWTTVKAGSGTYNSGATGTNIDALQLQSVIMRYVPSERCVLIFGGCQFDGSNNLTVRSGAIYRYDTTGLPTRIGVDIPTTDIWTFTKHSVWWVDPVTSELLTIYDPKGAVIGGNSFSGNPFQMRGLNVSTLTWSTYDFAARFPSQASWINTPDQVDCILPVPLSPYGVTMFMSYRLSFSGGQTQALLYKHAASTPVSAKLALVLR